MKRWWFLSFTGSLRCLEVFVRTLLPLILSQVTYLNSNSLNPLWCGPPADFLPTPQLLSTLPHITFGWAYTANLTKPRDLCVIKVSDSPFSQWTLTTKSQGNPFPVCVKGVIPNGQRHIWHISLWACVLLCMCQRWEDGAGKRFPLGTVCDIPTSTAHLDLNVLGGVGIAGRHRKHRPLRVISF